MDIHTEKEARTVQKYPANRVLQDPRHQRKELNFPRQVGTRLARHTVRNLSLPQILNEQDGQQCHRLRPKL